MIHVAGGDSGGDVINRLRFGGEEPNPSEACIPGKFTLLVHCH